MFPGLHFKRKYYDDVSREIGRMFNGRRVPQSEKCFSLEYGFAFPGHRDYYFASTSISNICNDVVASFASGRHTSLWLMRYVILSKIKRCMCRLPRTHKRNKSEKVN